MITRIILTVLIVLFAMPMAAAGGEMDGKAERAQQLSERLSSAWRCTEHAKIDVGLSFKLTNDGNAYDIRLTQGYENPFAIKAALHAVLFSMPFPNPTVKAQRGALVTCTIVGDKDKPTVTVSLSDAKAFRPGDEDSALKSIPHAEYKHQTFVMGAMDARLNSLCDCLFEFPDSSEILKEIGTLCSNIGLNTDNAHDWMCIARSRGTDVTTMRSSQDNEDLKDPVDAELLPLPQRACRRASVAAYFQAWKLKKDMASLYELEDAYAKYLALEIQTAAKADTLLLGSSALLSEQLYSAKEKYDQAINDGQNLAKVILAQMKGIDTDRKLKVLKLGSKFLPENGWEAILHWLPVDTELVAVGGLSTLEDNAQQNQMVLFSPLVTRKGLTGNETDQQLEVNQMFSGAKVDFALHAARTFKMPIWLGIGSSDGADFLVFDETSKTLPTTVMNKIRTTCTYRRAVEGVEVLSCYQEPFTFGRFASARAGFSGVPSYICSPYEGVLISATNIEYLREILMRLQTQPNDRALSVDLPEWKQIDTSANFWALRHYDKAYVPFNPGGVQGLLVAGMFASQMIPGESVSKEAQQQPSTQEPGQSLKADEEVGFLFYTSGEKITIKSLSRNESTLNGQAKMWRQMFGYKEGNDTSSNADFRCVIDKPVLTVEGTLPDISVIHLLQSLGYFVGI